MPLAEVPGGVADAGKQFGDVGLLALAGLLRSRLCLNRFDRDKRDT
jgi:hypothetical protein